MYSSNMVRINKNLLVHSLVGGNFGYFQLLTTTNNVAINIFAHVTWFTCAHISKEYKTRSRNARLHGVYIVNLFRSLLPNFFLNWLYHFSILLAVYMNVCVNRRTLLFLWYQNEEHSFWTVSVWITISQPGTSWIPHKFLPETRWLCSYEFNYQYLVVIYLCWNEGSVGYFFFIISVLKI